MQCVYATVPPPNMALPMAKLKATWPLYLINLWAVYKLVRTHLCVLRILNAVVCVCVCVCMCMCVCASFYYRFRELYTHNICAL